jgi:hypothetical protein
MLDDFIWLQAASHADAAGFFKDAFSFPPGSAFDASTPFWRPLVDTYFFAGWRVFGLEPLPYHVLNVLLHGAVASLLAVLVWQLTSSRIVAWLGGLLFVVLPTYDFAVTWVSSATELFGALFYLLTMVLYAGHLRGWGGRWCYWAALGALFLALLSKESAVTIPVALAGLVVAVDIPRSPDAVLRRAREFAPFAVLTAAYFIFLYFEEYQGGADDGLYQFGGHFMENMWDYLKWMTLPLDDDWASWVETARPFTAAAFLAIGVAAVALRNVRLAFAFLWTLLALPPYAFFEAGIEFRYTYLASVPFTIFLMLLINEAVVRLRPRVHEYPAALPSGAAVLLVLAAFLATHARDRQEALSVQAQAYHGFYKEVPAVCGGLPAGAHIFIISGGLADPFGVSTRMALNLRYDNVNVGLGPLPELAPFIEDKCVVEYDYQAGQYVRVE